MLLLISFIISCGTLTHTERPINASLPLVSFLPTIEYHTPKQNQDTLRKRPSKEALEFREQVNRAFNEIHAISEGQKRQEQKYKEISALLPQFMKEHVILFDRAILNRKAKDSTEHVNKVILLKLDSLREDQREARQMATVSNATNSNTFNMFQVIILGTCIFGIITSCVSMYVYRHYFKKYGTKVNYI